MTGLSSGRVHAAWRWGAAWAIANAGLATLLVLLARQSAVFGGTPDLDLGPTTIAVLDTVSFAGRTVRAQLDGVVESVEPDGTVWIAATGRAFEVALDEDAVVDSLGMAPERRLLVVGRLRGADGERWLDAEAWTLVDGAAITPPDAVEGEDRFAPTDDRSAARSDRSADPR